MNATVETLRNKLSADSIVDGGSLSERHFVDWSGEHPCAPIAVVRPRNIADISIIMQQCSRDRQPVVVQGGLTGLSGGATPRPGELAISLDRLVGIEELDAAAGTATVLAGTPLQAVQTAASEAGFLFPLDLGARGSCTIGGNIATNAGGNQVIRFGMMRSLVLGLEAVIADGTVVSSLNKMLKNNAGYDLKQLFIGTEGTLGIVTRATLRLYPLLPAKTTALCAVADFDAMIDLLHRLQAGIGGNLSAFEAMWDSYFGYVVEHVAGLRSPFDVRFPICVLVESEGSDARADHDRLEAVLADALAAGVLLDAAVARSEQDRENLWRIRDGIAEITPMLQPMLAFDVSLPIASMPSFLAQIDRAARARSESARLLVFGHVGDSNLHVAATTGREQDFPALRDIVYGTTGEHGGSVAAEHGVGTLRKQYLHYSRSAEEIALMRRLKGALDPLGILNPGRVIPD
jgi:FAD/FMN-containing dehydrogenase